MKVTEPRLNTLIDNLNILICEDNLLTRQDRETLVLAVDAIGAMKACISMQKGEALTRGRRNGRFTTVKTRKGNGRAAAGAGSISCVTGS